MPSNTTAYAAKAAASFDKLRGGYYTPDPIARFVADWVAQAGPRLLEPSCGDGAILRYLTKHSPDETLGIELDPSEAREASIHGTVRHEDFFSWRERHTEPWDGVAGNPPYIRFGHWTEQYRAPALDFMRAQNLAPTRLTNAWVPFVVAASASVRPGGRVGLVLPAELLQVGYAAELRAYLVDHFAEITLVTFRHLLFEGILQEVVLFLGVAGAGPAQMRVVHAEDAASLHELDLRGPSAPALKHDSEKWTKYFLSQTHIKALRSIRATKQLHPLGEFAVAQVGIVTGRNSFFTMTNEQAVARGVDHLCVPLVARTAQLKGLALNDVDLKQQIEDDVRALLLLASDEHRRDKALMEYVADGERHDVHQGYKCSIRDPWWAVPSYWVPDAFMFRQIHTHPRIVTNETQATSTDTVHRVRVRSGVSAERLAVAAFNSATFAYSEILGRSYGGGILELEPGEATQLPIVDPALVPAGLHAQLDDFLRSGDLAGAVRLADQVLLGDGLGWSRTRIAAAAGAWATLRDRRSGRGKGGTRSTKGS